MPLDVDSYPYNDERERFRSVATDMNILEIGTVMGRLLNNDLTNPGPGVMREIMLELHDEMNQAEEHRLDRELYWLVARFIYNAGIVIVPVPDPGNDDDVPRLNDSGCNSSDDHAIRPRPDDDPVNPIKLD
ncbi:hypothetical protein F5Y03DRAFT_399764 [Xylaria venustula]|nr:hypothetical protein F5Y03DRAFT_399764 [Xylaria venustula]